MQSFIDRFLQMREQVDRKEKKEKRRREKNFRLMLKSYKNQITQGSVFDDKVAARQLSVL